MTERFREALGSSGPEAVERALRFAPLMEHLRPRGEAHLDLAFALHHGGDGGGALILRPPLRAGGVTEIDHVTSGCQVVAGLQVAS